MPAMTDDAVRWLHRRAGFGLPIGRLREAESRGAEAELELLFATPAADDPWDDARLPVDPATPMPAGMRSPPGSAG